MGNWTFEQYWSAVAGMNTPRDIASACGIKDELGAWDWLTEAELTTMGQLGLHIAPEEWIDHSSRAVREMVRS